MKQEVIQKAEEKPKQRGPNMTGIPTQMKLDFEQRSGLSFDDVRVHYNSDKPRKIGALAYTQIPQVHIGPGQERHLRHELVHVVQQKEGRTLKTLGSSRNEICENSDLEKEAIQGVVLHSTKRLYLTNNNFPIQRMPNNLINILLIRLREKNISVNRDLVYRFLYHVALPSFNGGAMSRQAFDQFCNEVPPDFIEYIFPVELENCLRSNNNNLGFEPSVFSMPLYHTPYEPKRESIITFGDQELETSIRALGRYRPIISTSKDVSFDDRFLNNYRRLLRCASPWAYYRDVTLVNEGHAIDANGNDIILPPYIDYRRSKSVFDHPYTTGRCNDKKTQNQVQALCDYFFSFSSSHFLGRAQLTIRAVKKSKENQATKPRADYVYFLSPRGMFIYSIMRSHASTHRATNNNTESGIDPKEQSLTLKYVNFKVYFSHLIQKANRVASVDAAPVDDVSRNNALDSFMIAYNSAVLSKKWPMALRHNLVEPMRFEDILLHSFPPAKIISCAKNLLRFSELEDPTYEKEFHGKTGEAIMNEYKFNPHANEFSDASDDEY